MVEARTRRHEEPNLLEATFATLDGTEHETMFYNILLVACDPRAALPVATLPLLVLGGWQQCGVCNGECALPRTKIPHRTSAPVIHSLALPLDTARRAQLLRIMHSTPTRGACSICSGPYLSALHTWPAMSILHASPKSEAAVGKRRAVESFSV
jgi:hypothetical protein